MPNMPELGTSLKKKTFNRIEINSIIELAWKDNVSFNSIEMQYGASESEVIKIMRLNLKRSSFTNWRKRVSGRKSKHKKLR